MMIACVRVNFPWKEHQEERERKKTDLDNKHTIGLEKRMHNGGDEEKKN